MWFVCPSCERSHFPDDGYRQGQRAGTQRERDTDQPPKSELDIPYIDILMIISLYNNFTVIVIIFLSLFNYK